jgi:hypothetical protein
MAEKFLRISRITTGLTHLFISYPTKFALTLVFAIVHLVTHPGLHSAGLSFHARSRGRDLKMRLYARVQIGSSVSKGAGSPYFWTNYGLAS